MSAGQQVFVKIIDIDLERRRISLSLKQANEGVDPEGTDFDPALYGMHGEYDEAGNYVYPEGFNSETGEWLEGFDAQRAEWERDYAAAQSRWEAHKKQVAEMNALVIVPVEGADTAEAEDAPTSVGDAPESAGTLADDESLAALREKLQGSSDE